MNNNIKFRTLEEAEHILKTGQTIRETADHFKVSKSTLHKDIGDRLKNIDHNKYEKIKTIMQDHIDTRHIRGGLATKQKYLLAKK